MARGQAAGDPAGSRDEGVSDIGGAQRSVQPGLGTGDALPPKQRRLEADPLSPSALQFLPNLAGDNLRLVVAPFPPARPMQWHTAHQIHIGKVLRPRQATPEHAGEKPSGRKISVVLKRLSNIGIPTPRRIMEQRRSILIARDVETTFKQPFVKQICHRIPSESPKKAKRQVRHATGAQVLFGVQKLPAANQTHPRHQEVGQGAEKFSNSQRV